MKKICPTCNKEINDQINSKNLPFCSERCQLIDFGDWIDGTHHIPGEDKHDLTETDFLGNDESLQ